MKKKVDIEKIKKLQEEGLSMSDIAIREGVHKTTISKAVSNHGKKQDFVVHYPPEMGTSRYPREGESRDNFDRGSEARPIDYMDRRGSLYVDPEVAPDGYTLGWIVTDSRGKPMPNFLMSAMNRGWVPIKAAEHYSLSRNDRSRAIIQDVFKTTADEYVREGGQILCKRRTELHDREQDYYNKRQQERRNVGREEGLKTFADDPTYGKLDYVPVRPRSGPF